MEHLADPLPAYPHPVAAELGAPLVLASGSPRRRELLAQLGAPFEVMSADVDEAVAPGEAPSNVVRRLAAAKARAVSGARADAVVLGADTVVDLDGQVLGKPADTDHAAAILRSLSGRTHRVHTGVAVAADGEVHAAEVATAEVDVVELPAAVIEWYVATGEPLDKAGAYGLQGIGAVLVSAVRGSPSAVAGLPLHLTANLLTRV